MNNITLKDLCILLNKYKDTYGDLELLSIDTSNSSKYIFIVGNANGRWAKLPIPQCKEEYLQKINLCTDKEL